LGEFFFQLLELEEALGDGGTARLLGDAGLGVGVETAPFAGHRIGVGVGVGVQGRRRCRPLWRLCGAGMAFTKKKTR